MSTDKRSVETTYYVQIIEKKTSICERQMESTSRRDAERIKRGVEINLNHVDYKVIIATTKAVEGQII